MYKYSQDINFLKKICSQKNQKIYCQIFSLDEYDNIIKNLTGIIQNGSINLDGSSAIRRTCSLTILLQNLKQINYILNLNTKIKIEIGLENFTNKYLDNKIIWFPMGIYYLINFTIDNTAQGIILNLSAKDKMIKLTGDLGGTFNSTIEFGVINTETDIKGKFIKNKIKLKTIITEMVHTYGYEPYEKIFIYDLDDYGLNSISYQGEKPVYAFLEEKEDKMIVVNYMFDDNYIINTYNGEDKKLSELSNENKDFFISKYNILNEKQEYNSFYLKDDNNKEHSYYIKKCNKGDIIGYELAELTYIDDLIAAPGENVTSILNKILNILGKDNYEYYYDLNGNFIFKKQDQFIQIESYLNPYVSFLKPDMQFTDQIIINKTESFDLSKIKNDFTIWGKKNNSEQQFHVRIAIDKKPKQYISLKIDKNKEKELKQKYPDLYNEKVELEQESICYSVNPYSLSDDWNNESTWRQVDWREIIYQMAQDYKKFNQLSDFYKLIEKNNPEYVNGITGYERYYIDLDGFWRSLYVLEPEKIDIETSLSEDIFYTIDLTKPIVYFSEMMNDPDGEKFVIERNYYIDKDNEISKDKEENILYDIKSANIENQTVYRKRKNQDNLLYYEAIGSLNEIIQTNYKILQKIYYAANGYNDEDYFILRDIDTDNRYVLSARNPALIRLINNNIDLSNESDQERMNTINNKEWLYLKKDAQEPDILGIYYDITSLYLQINSNIKYGAILKPDEEKVHLFTPTESALYYKKIEEYPKNKQGYDLTNIQDFSKDKNGLILWAQANNKLTGINKNINQITHYNNKIYNDPANLIFWFDFLDNATFSANHFIQNIGPREYVQSKTNAVSIVNLYSLDNIFLNYQKSYTKDEAAIQNFYSTSFAQKRNKIPFFRMAKKDNKLFKISSNSISAIDLINNYIYNYNYMSSQMNIKAISQYFLQPNSLFDIVDLNNQSLITYIANKISFSFNVTSNIQMTINGIKLVDFNFVQQDLRKEILNE